MSLPLSCPRPTSMTAMAALAVAALAGVSPAGALGANNCQGAPGTSAVEQYCEAILEADGSRRVPPKRGASRDDTASAALPRELRQAGPDGLAVARFAATGPAAPTSKSAAATEGAAAGDPEPARPSAGSPSSAGGTVFTATQHAVAAGPAAGPGVVWGLALLSSLAVAGKLADRRRPSPLSHDDSGGGTAD